MDADIPAEGDDEEPLPPGTVLGDYRLGRRLGRGTFGDVYTAEQVTLGKRAAVKVLHQHLAADPELVARFLAEARAIAEVRHPGIVEVFAAAAAGEPRPFLVMELVEGEPLSALLDREKRLPVARALPILRDIASALDAAHAAGVVHRDLKPDNILMAPTGDGSTRPKLLDFGVAKVLHDPSAVRTATGVAVGTPRFMSPEQCRGKPVDQRADIYSLGVLTHLMLTGKAPFAGPPVDVLLKHMTETPPTMSSVCPDLPVALDAPVLAMLAKRPADRPATAGAALAALVEKTLSPSELATLPLGTIILPPSEQAPPEAPTLVMPPRAPQAVPAATVLLEAERTVPAPPPPMEVVAPTRPDLPAVAVMGRPKAQPSAEASSRTWVGAALALALVLGGVAFALLRGDAPDLPTAPTPSATPSILTTTPPLAEPTPAPTTPQPESSASAPTVPEPTAPAIRPAAPKPTASAKPRAETRDLGF